MFHSRGTAIDSFSKGKREAQPGSNMESSPQPSAATSEMSNTPSSSDIAVLCDKYNNTLYGAISLCNDADTNCLKSIHDRMKRRDTVPSMTISASWQSRLAETMEVISL